MTARRDARRARYHEPIRGAEVAVIDGHEAAAELFDPAATVWHDRAAYLRYMTSRSWPLPPKERMGVAEAPAKRRADAVAGWATDNGLTKGPFPDWARLRDLFGLWRRDSSHG